MDRYLLEQEFFQYYGYRGDEDELKYFAASQGYDYNEELSSDYLHSRRNYSDNTDDEYPSSHAGDAGSEFSALMRDLIGNARRNKDPDRTRTEHDLMTEFAYMAMLFALKTALYFTLRFCEENGYATNL